MKVADMHCDTIYELYNAELDGKQISLKENHGMLDLNKMKEGDYLLQNFALFTPLHKLPAGDTPFSYACKLADVFFEQIERNSDLIAQVRTFSDIEKNRKEGRMSALLTLEEGGVCQGDLHLLRHFYRMGVRMMTLTWNFPNELGFPAKVSAGVYKGIDFNTPGHGLTETGKAFVQEMERLGIMIDVSHLNDAGIRDVLTCTSMPLVASHSNARALCRHPRNLPDDLILEIAKRGGVIGINYYGAFLQNTEEGTTPVSRIEDMVRHICYIRDLAGIECIGLGSDFDGIDGELEMKTASDLPMLEQALYKAGFTEEEVEAIFYKNVLRVYHAVLCR